MILLNGKEINPTIFPDKTSQVWKISDSAFSPFTIEWKFEHEGELMHLAQLRRLLAEISYSPKVILKMPYLPYARQDKPVSNHSTFAMHVFADLINKLDFHQVYCFDPHSDAAEKLINNLVVKY